MVTLTLDLALFTRLGRYHCIKLVSDSGRERAFNAEQVDTATGSVYPSNDLSISGFPVEGDETTFKSSSSLICVDLSATQTKTDTQMDAH